MVTRDTPPAVFESKTAQMQPIVGAKEAAAILGIRRETLWRWRQQGHASDGLEFPPARILHAGPVWARADIEFVRDRLLGAGQ